MGSSVSGTAAFELCPSVRSRWQTLLPSQAASAAWTSPSRPTHVSFASIPVGTAASNIYGMGGQSRAAKSKFVIVGQTFSHRIAVAILQISRPANDRASEITSLTRNPSPCEARHRCLWWTRLSTTRILSLTRRPWVASGRRTAAATALAAVKTARNMPSCSAT